MDDSNKSDPVQDDTSKANLMADTFQKIHLNSFNSASPHEEVTLETVAKIQTSTPRYEYPNFTIQSLRNIIKTLPNKKSPGFDKISALHLKNLHKKPLVQLFYILQATLLGYTLLPVILEKKP